MKIVVLLWLTIQPECIIHKEVAMKSVVIACFTPSHFEEFVKDYILHTNVAQGEKMPAMTHPDWFWQLFITFGLVVTVVVSWWMDSIESCYRESTLVSIIRMDFK